MNHAAAASRELAYNHNWLNIGYTGSGPRPFTHEMQIWGDPVTAAHATAAWLKGDRTGPVDQAGYHAAHGIHDIMRTAGHDPQAQIHAIGQSHWAGDKQADYDHYEATIGRVYHDLGHQADPEHGQSLHAPPGGIDGHPDQGRPGGDATPPAAVYHDLKPDLHHDDARHGADQNPAASGQSGPRGQPRRRICRATSRSPGLARRRPRLATSAWCPITCSRAARRRTTISSRVPRPSTPSKPMVTSTRAMVMTDTSPAWPADRDLNPAAHDANQANQLDGQATRSGRASLRSQPRRCPGTKPPGRSRARARPGEPGPDRPRTAGRGRSHSSRRCCRAGGRRGGLTSSYRRSVIAGRRAILLPVG